MAPAGVRVPTRARPRTDTGTVDLGRGEDLGSNILGRTPRPLEYGGRYVVITIRSDGVTYGHRAVVRGVGETPA